MAVICTGKALHACRLRVNEKFSRLASCMHFFGLQDMLHCNIRQNETVIEESGGSATAFPFVWGQTKMEDLEEAWQRLDIILAADVIYHRELFDPLLSALSDLGEYEGHLITFSESKAGLYNRHSTYVWVTTRILRQCSHKAFIAVDRINDKVATDVHRSENQTGVSYICLNQLLLTISSYLM